jgi:hypothetical protein
MTMTKLEAVSGTLNEDELNVVSGGGGGVLVLRGLRLQQSAPPSVTLPGTMGDGGAGGGGSYNADPFGQELSKLF